MVHRVSKSQTWLKRLGMHAHNPINGLPWWLSGKESACQHRRCRFSSWVRKIPWRRKWQPTPVFFLPGESHGQRSLTGYSPWGHKRVGCDLATKQQQWVTLASELTSHIYVILCNLLNFSESQLSCEKYGSKYPTWLLQDNTGKCRLKPFALYLFNHFIILILKKSRISVLINY